MAEEHELEVLLSLDGFEFQFAEGYRVRIAAQVVEATSGRPHGVKYSLTLHDPAGRRVYGLDNAHRFGRRRVEFDHRHVFGRRRVVAYLYRGPIELLEDFLPRGRTDFAGTRCLMNRQSGTFEQFKEYTVAVARGARVVSPNDPKLWRQQETKPLKDYSIGDLEETRQRIEETEEWVKRNSEALPGPGWNHVRKRLRDDWEAIEAEINRRLPSS